MIIMPDPVPRLPTDYDGAWERIKPRTRLFIAAAAVVPVLAGIAAVATDAWDLGYVAILLAFLIWGSIGSYLGLVSDRLRHRRRLERTQFKALEGAELSAAERRDAVHEAQRRAAIEDMKRRRSSPGS